MVTLEDRFYERTIPEHGGTRNVRIDIPLVGLAEFERALKRIGDEFRRLGALLTPRVDDVQIERLRAVLRADIVRQCSGMRRRQARVRR